MTRRQWGWGLLALLLLVGVKVVLLRWYLQRDATPAPPLPVACDTRAGRCQLPGGAALLFLEPPTVGRPFTLRLQGVAADVEPSATFSMQSMDMGFNRYRFVRQAGGWELRATLPLCVSGRHDWQLTLQWADRRYLLPLVVAPAS